MDHNNISDGTNPDFNELLATYTQHWKWFLLSLFLCVALALAYIKYATPKYAATGTIQIIEEKNAGGIDVFQELGILSNSKNNVEDEIQILTSRSNFIEVVNNLNLNIRIIALGNIRKSEIYKNPPININFIAEDTLVNKANIDLYITLDSDTSFTFQEEEEDSSKSFAFGNNVPTSVGNIVITPNIPFFENYKGREILVQIRPVSTIAQAYKKRLEANLADDFSSIVSLYLEDSKRQKAMDIINNLVGIYNQNSITDKKTIADKTANFIDERIADISTNLSSVDQTAQDFKSDRGLTDIAAQSNINLNVGAANQQELANTQTQMNIAASMKDLVDQEGDYEVLPANIGLNDPTIANTTQQYNQLVLERERLLKSSNAKNPVIVNLDQQLEGLRNTMQSSLNSTVNNLGLRVNTLSGQQAIINSRIYSAPKNERALRDITRRQQTTESLYLYLLQKKEEAQVAAASTAPKSKIIDRAFAPSPGPVAPRKKVVLLASIIMGLLIPFGIFYIKDLLDNKVENMNGVEKLVTDIPILGELPRLTRKDRHLIDSADRSVLAEALRIIRTNLDYLIKTKRSKGGSKGNKIFITSGLSGEGKTFLSTNLSVILSSSGKKVLLIGADVRNPKFDQFFSGDNFGKKIRKSGGKEKGLTEFLLEKNLEMKDIAKTMEISNNTFDVIYSGAIPPNPAELLLNDRMNVILEEASLRYDYVIVDTAPLLLVTDTLLINSLADHMIYVVRANQTEEKTLQFPIKLQNEGKIKGLSFVVNDVRLNNLGYGGKYGYGYGNK